MITVNLMGGMGNLMFQYAYARALQEESGEVLKFNTQFMNLACIGAQHRMNKNNALLHFNLDRRIHWENPIVGYTCGSLDVIHYLALRRNNCLHGRENFEKLSQKGLLSTDDSITYYRHVETTKYSGGKIIGYFASPQYFKEIEKQIRKEFQVVTPPTEKNKEKMEELLSCNAVCVHIRRGDYISNPKNSSFVVCTEAYYKAGMDYIASHIKNPVFYIFSNDSTDIKWIQEHYHFDYPVQYIALNNPDYEELRLMYSCKHFVISNSTFSWWGSYLSSNPEKIIVAPTPWVKDYSASQDIYTSDMVLIDATGKRRDKE